MARDRQEQSQIVSEKDAPPSGYAKPKGHKGAHRSDPDFGHKGSMSEPVTVKPPPESGR